jgi:ubiquinone/menaquinone biosynthesis C-methylase UbiE
MNEDFLNVYGDKTRADAYADLEFPGTYYLAYRDLPAILQEHVRGTKAVDFGCGAGRSTRFLGSMGFDVIGIDISEHMITRAKERDPEGDYRLVANNSLDELESNTYDLVFSAFAFDNIATMEKKVSLFQSFKRMLKSNGCVINLVSAPEIYINEWTSFSTKDFPENRTARSGDKVRIVMLDVADGRPVEDIFWTDQDYQEVYKRAGLLLIKTHRPLASQSEPYLWINETALSPWAIYVLRVS